MFGVFRSMSQWVAAPSVALLALLLGACETQPTYLSQVPSSTKGGAVKGAGSGGRSGSGGTASSKPSKKDLDDGDECKDDSECHGGHCGNGFCCASGDCCSLTEDCPGAGDIKPVCDEPTSCQGSRGVIMCMGFRCRAKDPVDDDSACDNTVKADDCGLYAPIFCNARKDQTAPQCANLCSTDTDCDENAHCANGACVADSPDGSMCMTSGECESNHCDKGVCCARGECCAMDSDCDTTKYSTEPTCDDHEKCQGKKGAPKCEAGRCTMTMVDDDSACDRRIISNDCGAGPDVKCSGGVDQKAPPPCATGTCGGFTTPTCNAEAFCYQNQCVPDQPNGERCPSDAACQSGHCENGLCCDAGACCKDDSGCPPIRMCTDRSSCQGKRIDQKCDVETGSCKKGDPVDDDSGCLGQISGTDCGQNLPLACSAAANQMMLPPTACPRCAPGLKCESPFTVGLSGTCIMPNSEGGAGALNTAGPAMPDPEHPIGCRGPATCDGNGKCQPPGGAAAPKGM